ncbi:MAG: hypothetical protein JW940_35925 [Polyangiaceae bacterium]|nr:hypothetical protein [Polyangiaceae bacterium]
MSGARSRDSQARAPAAEDLASATPSRLVDAMQPPRVPRLRGARVVTAVLPSGRTVWLAVQPSFVSATEIERLRQAVCRSAVRRTLLTHAHTAAIERCSRTLLTDVQRLTRAQGRAARRIFRQLERGDAKVGGRFVRVWAARRAEQEQDSGRLLRFARRLRRRGLWDQIVLLSGAPLFAAYAERGRPLGVHNLTLTLSLFVWLFGDELTDLLSGRWPRPWERFRDVDVWSYVAPFGNLLSGWWLLGDRQHERFVTGMAESFERVREGAVAPSHRALALRRPGQREALFRQVIPLSRHIAPDHVESFEGYTGVRAVATLASGPLVPGNGGHPYRVIGISAIVQAGLLTIDVAARPVHHHRQHRRHHRPPSSSSEAPTALRVAWLVDTQDPKASTSGEPA